LTPGLDQFIAVFQMNATLGVPAQQEISPILG
jgi:hypothetical protein